MNTTAEENIVLHGAGGSKWHEFALQPFIFNTLIQ